MAMPWRPRLVDGATDITLTHPMGLWEPEDVPVGGGEVSASGAPSHYVVRWDALLYTRLRLTEAEWPVVSALLRSIDEAGRSITLYPDAGVPGVSHTVYLEHPSVRYGEQVHPTRDADYPWIYWLDVTWRRTTATTFDVRHGG